MMMMMSGTCKYASSVTFSGQDAVLKDVVQPCGVVEFVRIVVDPAADWDVLVVDLDGHTR